MTFKTFFMIREAQNSSTSLQYYHICKSSELSSILQKGLLAQHGSNDQPQNELPSVLLFRSLNDAKYAVNKWLRRKLSSNETLSLLLITLPNNFPINDDPRMVEVISRVDIPPSFIKILQHTI